ncbi:MAG: hypothetical protein IJP48_09300 [Synergistaceae bacterium]|nr:hypothetical protein [Synergistaceae bacterium]
MKRSRFVTVLVLSAMLLGVVQPVFAWGTRTGSRTGDAVLYGAGGGVLAAIGVGALCFFFPPAGVAVGTALAVGGGVGVVGGATYGALYEEKTVTSDVVAGATILTGGTAIGVCAPELGKEVLKGAALGTGGYFGLKAVEAVADENTKKR